MTTPHLFAFRFATDGQWDACLFDGADRRSAGAQAGMRPLAPYGLPPRSIASRGAKAPAALEPGEAVWIDGEGRLRLTGGCGEEASTRLAPWGLATARRLVAAPGMLWALGTGGIEAFEADSLARLLTVEPQDGRVRDIAADGRGGIFASVAGAILRIEPSGAVRARIEGIPDAEALAYLGVSGEIVLLAGGGTRLVWIDAERGTVVRTVLVSSLRGCFEACVLAGDGCGRLLLAGVDGAATGGGAKLLVLDEDGDLLAALPFSGTPTGATARGARLWLTTEYGLLAFAPAATVPADGREVRARLLTPALRSPARTPQRWTRIEAEAELPDGCSIEIAFAGAADEATSHALAAVLADRSLTPAARIARWRQESGARRFTFHGGIDKNGIMSVSAPLHDTTDPFLRVEVTLTAAPGGSLPRLVELRVCYPGPQLIEHLPAIYRRGEFETGNFLRALVGVLETTTQDLDARIGELGSMIHPDTAPADWLDFVARQIGLPWDDALALAQKRAIVRTGAALAKGHGTRAGLELLLASLMPETPRRYRVTDFSVDHGLLTLGGSRLPALLSGLRRDATELGSRAVLGKARLPYPDGNPPDVRLIGRVRIDLAVVARERRDWEPWLGRLVAAMLPVTAHAELRWLHRRAFTGGDALTEELSLEEPVQAALGTDAVLGRARIGGRPRTDLAQRLRHDSSLN